MRLSDYTKMVKGMLRDRGDKLLQLDDIEIYVNRARREIALRTQCIRDIPPIAGPITSLIIEYPGSGYTNPVVVITPPDFPRGSKVYPAGAQATGIAQQVAGHLSQASVVFGGDGYFQPQVSIVDPTGTGARVRAETIPLNVTQFNQEIYNFTDFPINTFAGISYPFAVLSIAMIFNGYRYTLSSYPFTVYQGFIRNYPQQYEYVPTIYSQYGQGVGGSLYMYPLPSMVYQFEADCLCLPADMIDDGSYEAIPQPWQDAVPYFAAHLCYIELQNFNAARGMLELYDRQRLTYSSGARPRYLANMYGRY
jgi:hypothetical protein